MQEKIFLHTQTPTQTDYCSRHRQLPSLACPPIKRHFSRLNLAWKPTCTLKGNRIPPFSAEFCLFQTNFAELCRILPWSNQDLNLFSRKQPETGFSQNKKMELSAKEERRADTSPSCFHALSQRLFHILEASASKAFLC